VDGVATRGCDVAATELLCANVGNDYDTGAAFAAINCCAACSFACATATAA
jgi:hypothetical protein